MVSLEFFY